MDDMTMLLGSLTSQAVCSGLLRQLATNFQGELVYVNLAAVARPDRDHVFFVGSSLLEAEAFYVFGFVVWMKGEAFAVEAA